MDDSKRLVVYLAGGRAIGNDLNGAPFTDEASEQLLKDWTDYLASGTPAGGTYACSLSGSPFAFSLQFSNVSAVQIGSKYNPVYTIEG